MSASIQAAWARAKRAPFHPPATTAVSQERPRHRLPAYSGFRFTSLFLPYCFGSKWSCSPSGHGHEVNTDSVLLSVDLTPTMQSIDNWLEIWSRLLGLWCVILCLYGGLFIEAVRCRLWDGPWCRNGLPAQLHAL